MLLQTLYLKYLKTRSNLRSTIWGLRLRSIGHNVEIESGVFFSHPKDVTIGNNVFINLDTIFLSQGGPISVGDYVRIGPRCNFISFNHDISKTDSPMYEAREVVAGYIEIQDDVWIGANVTVLPNVVIGKGAVIGAGAVVTKNVEPYTIAAGVPARKIKKRSIYKNNKNRQQSIEFPAYLNLLKYPRIINGFMLVILLDRLNQIMYNTIL